MGLNAQEEDKIVTPLRRKPENNTLQRQKNTKEIIINRIGTRVVKDGEDWQGLQTIQQFNPPVTV